MPTTQHAQNGADRCAVGTDRWGFNTKSGNPKNLNPTSVYKCGTQVWRSNVHSRRLMFAGLINTHRRRKLGHLQHDATMAALPTFPCHSLQFLLFLALVVGRRSTLIIRYQSWYVGDSQKLTFPFTRLLLKFLFSEDRGLTSPSRPGCIQQQQKG